MATVATIMGGKQGPAVASAQAGQVTVQRGEFDTTVLGMEDAALQVRVVKLPAGHRIIDLVMDNDDLDTGATGAVDIGIEDDIQDPADTTNLLLFATAVAVQTAAIRANHMSFAAARLAPQNYDRFIVITLETVSATGLVGKLGLTLTSQPDLGAQFLGNE
jgi:hypothetical protein